MADNKKITVETTATISELAAVLGITTRRIRQLVDEGVIVPVGKNTYPLSGCVQQYIRFLKSSVPEEAEVEIEKKRAQAEADLKFSKAKIAAMQAEELEGNMHRSEDVAAMTEDLIFAIRSGLLALPGRLAVMVSPIISVPECADAIRKEIYHLMEELSRYRYDPEEYARRVRERIDWSTSPTGDDNDE